MRHEKHDEEIKMIITPDTQKQLDELRATGLNLYAAMKDAEQAYADAVTREKAAYEYAANHGEFFTEDGERVTTEEDTILMDSKIFADEFVPLITQGYNELFGLSYPVGYTPLFEQFLTPLNDLQKSYRHIAVDYLRICGMQREADAIENALNTYADSEFLAKIDKINRQFLGVND